jgi:hypothetical protein
MTTGLLQDTANIARYNPVKYKLTRRILSYFNETIFGMLENTIIGPFVLWHGR